MPVTTRKTAQTNKITMSREQEVAAEQETGDPVWDGLMRLPFFKMAPMERKQELYEQEREKEREKENQREKEKEAEREKERREREIEKEREREREREFELRKLQLEKEKEIRLRELSAERRRGSNPNDPTAGKPHITIPAWTATTRPDKFFSVVEKLFDAASLPKHQWVSFIIDKLSEKARNVYSSLSSAEANNYDSLKAAILTEYHVSPAVYRKNFFGWVKRHNQSYVEYVKELSEQLDLWTAREDPSSVDWRDLLLKYRFESQLSEELSLYILDKQVTDLKTCITLADEYALHRRMLPKSRVNSGETTSHKRTNSHIVPGSKENQVGRTNSSNYTPAESRSQPPPRQSRSQKFCNYCRRTGHERSDCWADPNNTKYKQSRRPEQSANNSGTDPLQKHSTACATPQNDEVAEPVNPLLAKYTGSALVRTHEKSSRAFSLTFLRDTGSTLSMVRMPPGKHDLRYTGQQTVVQGVNHTAGSYPVALVYIDSPVYKGELSVAILPKRAASGVDVILGNDIEMTGDKQSISGVATRAQTKQASPKRDDKSLDPTALQPVPWDTANTGVEKPPVNDASPKKANCDQENVETVETPTIQSLSPELLSCEQDKDSTLTPIWEMAGGDAETKHGYFVKEEPRMLMRRVHVEGRGISKVGKTHDQIIVPKVYREEIIRSAHDTIASGHQGSKKTLGRITSRFYWPGIRMDVKRFCRSCGPCQRAGRGEKIKVAPLKPLPVIKEPFSFVSADFVGPLQTTPQGNKYILNIIDHATKYVESFPSPTATAQDVVIALSQLISRHGQPKTLLTDRGSCFVGETLAKFLAANDIRHLTASGYSPQTNGLCEQFNGQQKAMLKILLENSTAAWDELLPWVLFAYRSAEHSTTGFTPFELLYGRQPRDTLDAVYDRLTGFEPCEEVPCDRYVLTLRNSLREALDSANLSASQAVIDRQRWYDKAKKTKLRDFKRGEMVLARIPLVGKPLKNPFQGPYPIHEKVGSHTYIVHMPDKRNKYRVMHINQLKPGLVGQRKLRLLTVMH